MAGSYQYLIRVSTTTKSLNLLVSTVTGYNFQDNQIQWVGLNYMDEFDVAADDVDRQLPVSHDSGDDDEESEAIGES